MSNSTSLQPLEQIEQIEPIPKAPTLLHNMSAPPRTQIVLAPGRKKPRFVSVRVPAETFARAAEIRPGPEFVCRLAEQLGLGRAGTRQGAEDLLQHATEQALEQHGVASAAVCSIGPSQPHEREYLDPLLALAIVSRCAGTLFLRARTPRFDSRHVREAVRFFCGSEPWRSK